jgi:hypothetical protein
MGVIAARTGKTHISQSTYFLISALQRMVKLKLSATNITKWVCNCAVYYTGKVAVPAEI